MKTKLIAPLVGLLVSLSVVSASASDSLKVSVKTDRDLRVTIVDQSKSKQEAREIVREALTSSIAAGLSRESKSPMQVKAKLASVSRAAKDLRKGECDALIVIGVSVPSDLLDDGVVVLKASSARSADLDRTFYLLGHPRDQSMNQALALAFDQAMKSTTFQDALAGKPSKSSLAVADR
jgi:hypothetical protein